MKRTMKQKQGTTKENHGNRRRIKLPASSRNNVGERVWLVALATRESPAMSRRGEKRNEATQTKLFETRLKLEQIILKPLRNSQTTRVDTNPNHKQYGWNPFRNSKIQFRWL